MMQREDYRQLLESGSRLAVAQRSIHTKKARTLRPCPVYLLLLPFARAFPTVLAPLLAWWICGGTCLMAVYPPTCSLATCWWLPARSCMRQQHKNCVTHCRN